jgi:hypothetical protein
MRLYSSNVHSITAVRHEPVFPSNATASSLPTKIHNSNQDKVKHQTFENILLESKLEERGVSYTDYQKYSA